MGQGQGGWDPGAQTGCCIVLPSHRLPGPAGLPLCSEMLQHPRGLPEALGCSSPPNWMPWTISEDSLCQEKKSWELSKSGRVGVPGEQAASCPSLGLQWGCRGPQVGDTSQDARVTVATLVGVSARLPGTARDYVDPAALWGVALLQLTSAALPAAGELSACRGRAWLALVPPWDPPTAWWLGVLGSSFVSWLLWPRSPLP